MANHIVAELPQLPTIDGANVRHVVGFPGYAVSSTGRIFTCRKVGYAARGFSSEWREMRQRPTKKHGYLFVCMRRDQRVFTRTVHRVVLETFVGPRPDGSECCHHNDIPSDNEIRNLRWGTRASNRADATRNGGGNSGARNGRAKLTADDVSHVRTLLSCGHTCAEISRAFGVSHVSISRIKHDRSWHTHK